MKVSLRKDKMRFIKREIQNSKYIRPFEVITRIGLVPLNLDYHKNLITFIPSFAYLILRGVYPIKHLLFHLMKSSYIKDYTL